MSDPNTDILEAEVKKLKEQVEDLLLRNGRQFKEIESLQGKLEYNDQFLILPDTKPDNVEENTLWHKWMGSLRRIRELEALIPIWQELCDVCKEKIIAKTEE